MTIRFPDPRLADEHGIVFVGGELSEANIMAAYSRGIFPWPHENMPLLWFCPEARGILDFKNFHVPTSARKQLGKKNFRVSVDENFSGVIEGCANQKRDGQNGTWITEELLSGYRHLHEKGIAHSFECWSGDELVGGLYGVYVKGVFSGESMFFKESGASKACLISAVRHLEKMGHTWFDIQMVTPVLDLFGGCYVSRDDYLKRLERLQMQNIKWAP